MHDAHHHQPSFILSNALEGIRVGPSTVFRLCLSTWRIRRSYVDRTEKTVYISFAKRGVTKTKAKLILVAADLEWDVRWPRAGAPHIAFYDLPDGVSSYDDNAKALQRVILTKRYRFDPKADAFIEYPGASSLQNFDR